MMTMITSGPWIELLAYAAEFSRQASLLCQLKAEHAVSDLVWICAFGLDLGSYGSSKRQLVLSVLHRRLVLGSQVHMYVGCF